MRGGVRRSAGVSPAEKEAEHSNLKGWHSRGYLPHFDAGSIAQSVTFRLWDSIPQPVFDRIQEGRTLRVTDPVKAAREEDRLIEKTLGRGLWSCVLRTPKVADTVQGALLHFDGDRCRIYGWCVMPDHVHALFTPSEECSLSDIMHSWKSYTTHRLNPILDREGSLWQEDYFDRFIRDERHFDNALAYIERNPVVAHLCDDARDWPFSSARHRMSGAEAGGTPALRQEEEYK